MLLAAVWALPLTVNTIHLLVRLRRQQPPSNLLFTNKSVTGIVSFAAVVGLLAGAAGFAGAILGLEFTSAVGALFQIATCYTLMVYCNILLSVWPEEPKQTRFYRDRVSAIRVRPANVLLKASTACH